MGDDGEFKRKRVDLGNGPGKEAKVSRDSEKDYDNEGPSLSVGQRIRGGLKRAGEAARDEIKKAATYQPSKATKKAVSDVAHTARREFQEAGDYYTGGRRRRSGRTNDVFGLGSWAAGYGYSATESKPRYRETRTSVRRGRVTVVERVPYEDPYSGGAVHDPYGMAGMSEYLDNFDPFKKKGKRSIY